MTPSPHKRPPGGEFFIMPGESKHRELTIVLDDGMVGVGLNATPVAPLEPPGGGTFVRPHDARQFGYALLRAADEAQFGPGKSYMNHRERAEHECVLPTELEVAQGVEALEILPEIPDSFAGKRVKVTVEVIE